MKIAGWIFLVIGALGFIGAAAKGNSVAGPLMCLALGIFFLYRVKNKEQENKTISGEKTKNVLEDNTYDPIRSNQFQSMTRKSDCIEDKNTESLKDIQSHLSVEQREAALCLISFFGGFNNNLEDEAPMAIFRQAADFFGLSYSPMAMSAIMARYSDVDYLIDTVLTIRNVKAKEFLLLTCYDLISKIDSNEAMEILHSIARDMGYNHLKLNSLIAAYQ